MPDIHQLRATFRTLHEEGCFVIPNPWDIGSARFLESLGFSALATTSSGYAFSRGRSDGVKNVPLSEALDHFAEMASSVGIPISADFQSGYSDSTAGVSENVRRCIETGVAGLSIEDASGDPSQPLFELERAVDRLAAARSAIDRSGTGVVLTGRCESFLVGHPDPFEESLCRLQAYALAGADVLFAPGISRPEQIRKIVEAARPKPVNVIVSSNLGLRVSDLANLGVRRISVGSALCRTAWTGFIKVAREIAESGDFTGFEGAVSFSELNGLFS